ncbi:MAG TPA: glycosyltransferase [Acidimicrobiales bacterium]|nr:glycosyltransferase [Acidimicrobiales bacterium]
MLIVDDASTDATEELADKLAADDGRIRVVHHAVNRRLGGTIKTGLAQSRGQLVLYTDADLPFDLADLAKARSPLAGV